jgi:UDP-N-acetylglucosamine acyltransferase
VQVGGHAFISGNAIVHQFTRIGRLAMLGGGSGIGMDVPPFCTAGGVQRNHISGLNVVGLRRAGIPAEQRKQIKQAFHLLYKSNLSRTDAAAEIRSRFAAGPALEFAEFIEQSKRGICGQRENRA